MHTCEWRDETTKRATKRAREHKKQNQKRKKYIFKCAKRWVHHIVVLGYLCAILPCTHWPYSYFLHGSAHLAFTVALQQQQQQLWANLLHAALHQKWSRWRRRNQKREENAIVVSGEIERYTAMCAKQCYCFIRFGCRLCATEQNILIFNHRFVPFVRSFVELNAVAVFTAVAIAHHWHAATPKERKKQANTKTANRKHEWKKK